MRFVIVCLAVSVAVVAATQSKVSHGIFDNFVEYTPAKTLLQLISGRPVNGSCESEAYLTEHHNKFERELGLNSSYTWRNAARLWERVQLMFKSDSLSTFQKLCLSRDNFYYHMGQAMYNKCINVFSLLRFGDDIENAATYVRMWTHFDFICNVAFEMFLTPNLYSCVATATYSNNDCLNKYQAAVNKMNPCLAVEQYMLCQKKMLNIICGIPTGYYSCEDIRLGYGSSCINLRCNVN